MLSITPRDAMAKNRIVDKLKEGVSVHEIEGFAGKHTTEIFTVLAIIIGAISSSYDFFTGPKLTIAFVTIGALVAFFFPAPVEKGLKQLYSFTFKQEKMTEVILGAVKIVVAIFVPFLYFGLLGLLAGTSYHYYIRHAQIMSENRSSFSRKSETGDEHD
jgi:hypothetical protein